jgi:hypothetical protein
MTAPENPEPLNGTFWQADTPDRRVPGQLTLDDRPALETVGQIFVERAVEVDLHPSGAVRRMAVSGDPDALVADWEPRTIYGELDDGTLVSVVGAQGGRKRLTAFVLQQYRQEFRTLRHVILNEHVDDRQTFDSCRFRLVGPIWWRSEDGEASTAGGGRLVITEDGDDRWFEFTPARPLTVRDLDRRVLSPIATLASLVTDNPADAIDLSVRVTAESPWRKVHRAEESVPSNSHELLDSTHLSADRFARWIDFRRRSDALDAAAIDDLSGVAIQTAVLTLAAVAEGLHRRLFDEKKRVPALSKRDLVQARRAARGAAVDRVSELDRSDREPLTEADLAEFKQAVNDAFGFINEQAFRTRMADLASTAQAALPNIVVAFADWPKASHEARNTLAHRGTQPHSETIDQFYDLLIALSYSIAWVLRTVLLIEAGFDAATLQEADRDSSRYNHHIANTRNLLAGGPYAAQ